MSEYQEIILQESKTLTQEINDEKAAKMQIQDENQQLKLENERQKELIEMMKLQINELEGYKVKYENSANV